MGTLTQEIWELKSWHDARRGKRRPLEVNPLEEERLSRDVPENGRDRPEYLPTLAEIQAACLEIQAEWSDSERRRRAGERPAVRSVRMIHICEKL